MANARKKNVIYVDATGDITVDAIKPILYGVLVTPSADNSRFVLKESNGGTIVVDIKIVPTESRYLDLSGFNGIELSATFNVDTLTNITSVQLFGSWLGAVGEARGKAK